MALTLIQYLRLTFESISAEFWPVWVKLAVLRTKMRECSILTFDLTLTWHVTFQEKFVECCRTASPRPFQRRLARLAAVIGLGVSLGGVIRPPPPRSMAFGWDPGQARVKYKINNKLVALGLRLPQPFSSPWFTAEEGTSRSYQSMVYF